MSIKYIEDNYNKDLNLDSVAREIYITPGYLSLLFKQITGINFVDFLHKTRIKKACEYLVDFRLKTYEISLKVGYNDEKYFSQIFKKYMGVTPTQYRHNIRI
jgi:two-component system response regulator YesN